MFAVHPQQLTGCRIQRHHGPARTGGGINHAVRHERRSFEVEFRTRTKVVGFESPRHLELAEIVRVDLVERRIVRVSKISAVGAPLSVSRSGLAANR